MLGRGLAPVEERAVRHLDGLRRLFLSQARQFDERLVRGRIAQRVLAMRRRIDPLAANESGGAEQFGIFEQVLHGSPHQPMRLVSNRMGRGVARPAERARSRIMPATTTSWRPEPTDLYMA